VTGLPPVPRLPAQARPPERTPLQALRRDWGEAYLIGRDAEHGWWASRRGRVGMLIAAAGPEELRAKIRAHYYGNAS
jgi:hypothetical protein